MRRYAETDCEHGDTYVFFYQKFPPNESPYVDLFIGSLSAVLTFEDMTRQGKMRLIASYEIGSNLEAWERAIEFLDTIPNGIDPEEIKWPMDFTEEGYKKRTKGLV